MQRKRKKVLRRRRINFDDVEWKSLEEAQREADLIIEHIVSSDEKYLRERAGADKRHQD